MLFRNHCRCWLPFDDPNDPLKDLMGNTWSFTGTVKSDTGITQLDGFTCLHNNTSHYLVSKDFDPSVGYGDFYFDFWHKSAQTWEQNNSQWFHPLDCRQIDSFGGNASGWVFHCSRAAADSGSNAGSGNGFSTCHLMISTNNLVPGLSTANLYPNFNWADGKWHFYQFMRAGNLCYICRDLSIIAVSLHTNSGYGGYYFWRPLLRTNTNDCCILSSTDNYFRHFRFYDILNPQPPHFLWSTANITDEKYYNPMRSLVDASEVASSINSSSSSCNCQSYTTGYRYPLLFNKQQLQMYTELTNLNAQLNGGSNA